MSNPVHIATFPDLTHRVAVVTGGSGAIGAATAHALAANGVRVALIARETDRLHRAAATVGGDCRPYAADCQDPHALAGAVAAIEGDLGAPDILCTFAGGDGMPVPTETETQDHWNAVIDGNLGATFTTIRAFLPGLLARGRASVVTMSSSAGRQASRSNAAYAASKAAVVGLTRHLALEYGPRGVRVNCLAPATIENAHTRQASPEQRERMTAVMPLGRIGQPDDVASAALFLASDASAWLTGITIDVAGGFAMP